MNRLCPKCGVRTRGPANVDHRQRIRLDRKWYDIHVPALPVERCSTCGEVYFGGEADAAIQHALRDAASLLQPEEIQHGMRALGIETQRELAELLGVAPESLTRWITGDVIQGRLANTLLSVFFACPEARAFLRRQVRSRSFAVAPDPQRKLPFIAMMKGGVVTDFVPCVPDASNRGYALAA